MAKLLQTLGKYSFNTSKNNKLLNVVKLNFDRNRTMALFRKAEQAEDQFILLKPTPHDVPEILDLMWEAYHPEEPTTASIALGYQRNAVFDDSAIQKISKGYSYIARCKYDGCIVAACLNDVSCPWDADMLEKFSCTLECQRIVKLYMFWAYLQRAPQLYDMYCSNQVFEIANVFVRHADRNKGLGRRLIKKSIDLGTDCRFPVIRVDATSVHTAEICKKLKMKMVYEIPYCSYVGANGSPIFEPPPPNLSVKVFVATPHAMTSN